MNDDPITAEQADALLRFLPLFSDPGFQPVTGGGGGVRQADGSFTTPYPIYAAEVDAFFRLAGQPCWADYGYNPREAGAMLADDARVRSASLAEVKSMLTYCVRAERFGDGAWGHLISSGRLTALLQRLATLRRQPGQQ